LKIKSSIDPSFAAVTFPALIRDGHSYILLSVEEAAEEGELELTLRIGGALMQDDKGNVNHRRIAHLLKVAGSLAAEEDDDNILG